MKRVCFIFFVVGMAMLPAASLAADGSKGEEPSRIYKNTGGGAEVVAATFLGGKGHEWLAGGAFAPDGSVIVVGNVIGPDFDPGVAVSVIGKDSGRPAEARRIAVMEKGQPKNGKDGKAVYERLSWRHPDVTAFVDRGKGQHPGSNHSADPPAQAGANQPELQKLLVHLAPTEPKDSLKTFQLETGLRIELAASEPLVSDPVDVAWDEDGRLYVCELWNYPGVPKPGEPLGKIRRLESSRHDGVYDKSTVFADNVMWPGGVLCWDGGVFVVSSPDIWYMKDTDGDGKADIREKVFTGFKGRTYEVANSLRWGLDNRIYVSASYSGGVVSRVGKDGKAVGEPVRSRIFRFDPRTREIEAVSGGGEWGLSFDDWGEQYTCDATHLAWHAILARDELARNPYLAVRTVQEMSIAEWTPVYPISRPEPWKAAREEFWSRWKNSNSDMRAGRFPKTELAPHGFATSAAGITIYRGSALGEAYRNNAFIGEPANNVVIRLNIQANGVAARAERPANDAAQKREFLASTDNWFRPVNFANGPDGCLYVVAMYREVVEDETAIPNDILKHYDLYSGRNRGRIYRICSQDFKASPPENLSTLTTAQLVAQLDHPDAWRCETAQRLLYQHNDTSAAKLLNDLAHSAKTPQGRIRALWTAQGLSGLREETLQMALRDPDAHVRRHAAKLAQFHLKTPGMKQAILTAAGDSSAAVRFEAAFALGRVDDPRAIEALAKIARLDAGDVWIRAAILAAVPNGASELLALLAADDQFMSQPDSAALIAGLAEIVGTGNDSRETTRVLSLLSGESFESRPSTQREAIRRLADGLARSGSSLSEYWTGAGAAVPRSLAGLFEHAAQTALSPKAKERDRIDAIGLLAHAPFDVAEKPLTELVLTTPSGVAQTAAIRALAVRPEKKVADILLGAWPHLGPSVRPVVIEALFRRPTRLPALLDAIQAKTLSPLELEPKRREALLQSKDPSIRRRAMSLLGKPLAAEKNRLIENYQGQIAKLEGNAARGAEIFKNNCAACHRPEQGEAVGPNLATLEDRPPGTLLISILDPNRDVKPNFIAYSIKTKSGDELTGVIAGETANSITLRQAAGIEEIILRKNIQSIASTGKSLMPESLEAAINSAQMADLIAFLRELRK